MTNSSDDRDARQGLRIAIVTSTFLPAVNGIVTLLIHSLAPLRKLGHEVMVIAPEGGPAEMEGAQVHGVPGHPLPWYPDLKIAIPDASVFAKLRQFKPDVIHCIDPWLLNTLGLACMFWGKDHGIPMVASYNTRFPDYLKHYGVGFFEEFLWQFLRGTYSDANQALTVSPQMIEELEAHGIGPAGLWKPGVDLDLFTPERRSSAWRERLGATAGGPLLLYVGRLAAEKGLDLLRPVLDRLPEASLAFVGDGPYRSRLAEIFRGTRTHFAGFLKGIDLASAYAAADVFVNPSCSEAGGLVPVEAAAAGSPVVSARAGGNLDTVKDGVTGFLVDPRDPDAYVRAIGKILESPATQEGFRKSGRDMAMQWSWEAATEGLVGQYREAIRKNGRVEFRYPAPTRAEITRAFEEAVRSLPQVAFKMGALGKTGPTQAAGIKSLLPLLGISAGVGGILWAANGAEETERDEGIMELCSARAAPAKRASRDVKVATWNIAYGRGNGTDDGGPWPRALIAEKLDAIAEVIRSADLDIVALQEVDFGSARTHDIDQARYIAEKAGLSYVSRITTWQRNFVPYPFGRVDRYFGRIWSGQCVLSKYPILSNDRQELGALRFKPYWYQLFSIDRRVQHCRILWEGELLDVLNVHLERYSARDRALQAGRLGEIVASVGPARSLVLGDFNAPSLSAGQLHGFEDDPLLDFRDDATLDLVREQGLNLLTDPGAAAKAPRSERFHTFPAAAPTRGTDHILLGKDLEAVDAYVLTEASAISDHLPVVAQIRV
ncbi:MAG TPA: glycosyltransferase [Stellaceae bacterium]|nr:glycosyltransferase [Stellaceae bacterium]